MEEHMHEWGPIEVSHFAGTVHRKCTIAGCKYISIDFDEDDEE